MIDPVRPVFGERARHRVVDFAAGAQIGSQRLFQPDPGLRAGQAARGQPGDGGFEQAGCGRQENREALVDRPHFGGQGIEPGQIGGIERLIVQAVEKFGHAAPAVGRHEFFQRFPREVAETRVVMLVPRGADDLQAIRDQPVSMERTERWQQHALGQVAGRAEQQQPICGKAH